MVERIKKKLFYFNRMERNEWNSIARRLLIVHLVHLQLGITKMKYNFIEDFLPQIFIYSPYYAQFKSNAAVIP